MISIILPPSCHLQVRIFTNRNKSDFHPRTPVRPGCKKKGAAKKLLQQPDFSKNCGRMISQTAVFPADYCSSPTAQRTKRLIFSWG